MYVSKVFSRWNRITFSFTSSLSIVLSNIIENNAVITGTILDQFTSDPISGVTVTVSSELGSGFSITGADGTYRIYAGHATPASAPFRVKQDGTVIIETSSSSSTSRLVLEDDTIFSYKCDDYYNASSEKGIIYNDDTLNINWKFSEDQLILAEKDLYLPTFESLFK